MVVEETELAQRLVERFERIDHQPIELLLEDAKEPLNASVLPRASGIDSPMTDAKHEQRGPKHLRDEGRFVVRLMVRCLP